MLADHVAVEDQRSVGEPCRRNLLQRIGRPQCRVALWSHYAGTGPHVRFVRVGTLDEPARLPPDIHVFTETKLPWVTLPEGVPAVPAFYDRKALWRPDSLARREAILPQIQAWLAARPAPAPLPPKA